MIRTVIFDIDNTLYSYDKAHKKAFQALSNYMKSNLNLSCEEFEKLHKEMKSELDQFMKGNAVMHNRLIRYQNILEASHLPLTHAIPMYECYWNTLISNMEEEKGASECFRSLKEMGIQIGIGTDMTARIQFDKLIRLDLLKFIDFIVSSEEALCEKPDPDFFSYCLKKARAAANECLFVGDSLKKDALGASSCGMQGIHYCPDCSDTNGPMKSDQIYRITCLTQLPQLVQFINTTLKE